MFKQLKTRPKMGIAINFPLFHAFGVSVLWLSRRAFVALGWPTSSCPTPPGASSPSPARGRGAKAPSPLPKATLALWLPTPGPGGKWTTYRQMAEDTLDACVRHAKGRLGHAAPCRTRRMMLMGGVAPRREGRGWTSDAPRISLDFIMDAQ